MYVAYLSTVLPNLHYRWVKLAKKVLSEREGDKHNSIIPTMNRCRWPPSCCWVMGEGRNQILCKLTTVYTHTGVCATKCTAALGKQGQLMQTHVLSQVPKKGTLVCHSRDGTLTCMRRLWCPRLSKRSPEMQRHMYTHSLVVNYSTYKDNCLILPWWE